MKKSILLIFVLIAVTVLVIGKLVFEENKPNKDKPEPQKNVQGNTQEKIAVIFEKTIYEENLGKNVNVNKTDELALILEFASRDLLPSKFNIDISDEEVEKWLSKEHPDALSNSILGRQAIEAKKIYTALKSFQEEELTKTQAFDKYLKDIMALKDWEEISKQFSSEASMKFLKSEIEKSKEDVNKATIKLYRDRYVMGKLGDMVCKSSPAKEQVESMLSKVLVRYSGMAANNPDVSLTKTLSMKRKEFCQVFALDKVVEFQKENVAVINSGYIDVYAYTPSYHRWMSYKNRFGIK